MRNLSQRFLGTLIQVAHDIFSQIPVLNLVLVTKDIDFNPLFDLTC